MPITKSTIILVVDDFESMRKVTSSQLETLGAAAKNILQAKDGAEALRILQNHLVDIVITDWNMPVMTGLDLLIAMRANAKLSRLPVLMITAEAERARVEQAISYGVSGLLVKPYTPGALLDRIERAMTWRPRKVDVIESGIEPAIDAPVSLSKETVRSTILVVDDTPDNLHLISQLFKDEYRVRIAHSGEKALEICTSNNPPDIVLLDIMMPGIDGFEVAKRMREHPNSENIPVIFVTAMTDQDAKLKGMELGAVDFVTKPIDPTALIPRVRNFMRFVELRKQLQADYDGMLEMARLKEDVEHITRHDLKGPLAGVIGLIQAMEEDDSTSRKQFEQLRLVEETALQLLNMINLSSELFKIETGRFKLDAQPVKISDILRRIVEVSRTTYNEKHLTISVDTDITVVGDKPLQILGDSMFCYSLFQNLVKNACEAAPEKTRVIVSLVDEDPVQIKIQNKGAVPAAIRNSFFERFVTQGKSGGTGLGTYSARLLAEAQNGHISLDVSDEDNLTIVTVSLPRLLEVDANVVV